MLTFQFSKGRHVLFDIRSMTSHHATKMYRHIFGFLENASCLRVEDVLTRTPRKMRRVVAAPFPTGDSRFNSLGERPLPLSTPLCQPSTSRHAIYTRPLRRDYVRGVDGRSIVSRVVHLSVARLRTIVGRGYGQ